MEYLEKMTNGFTSVCKIEAESMVIGLNMD